MAAPIRGSFFSSLAVRVSLNPPTGRGGAGFSVDELRRLQMR